MDTAQNQVNTTGGQFAYPDFSQNSGNLTPPPQPAPVSQPSTPPPQQPVVNNVSVPPVQPIQTTSVQAQQPVVNDVPTPSTQSTPVPQPISATPPAQPQQEHIDQQKLDELKKDIDALLDSPTPAPVSPKVDEVKTESYVQEPTELPNISTPPSTPQNQQVWNDSLTTIMPNEKVAKALEREEKPNNLATPVNVIDPNKQKTITIEGMQNEFSMDALLAEVIKRNASDLHITSGYPPVIRIDGELIDVGEKIVTPKDAEDLVLSILPDDKKELLDVNREIDFAYSYEGGENMSGRFRVNAFHAMKHITAALRLIPTRVKTITELQLPQVYHQITKLKQGLVLVTGPTGHGKSTTLAAMLEDINRNRFVHIVTIEDPVEYIFEGKKALIDQREMNDDTNSWSIALRSAMRQDPDVILVGEMRDYETIAAAITLAETGHLVFATLHTNNAAQTIDRVIDVFPENQQPQVRSQLSNILQVVIAQRLIPLDKGGRRAVSEIMFNTPAIANLIREGKTHQIDNVIRTGADVGMTYLERNLVSLVREGAISTQKAQEYAVHPEEVLRLLKS